MMSHVAIYSRHNSDLRKVAHCLEPKDFAKSQKRLQRCPTIFLGGGGNSFRPGEGSPRFGLLPDPGLPSPLVPGPSSTSREGGGGVKHHLISRVSHHLLASHFACLLPMRVCLFTGRLTPLNYAAASPKTVPSVGLLSKARRPAYFFGLCFLSISDKMGHTPHLYPQRSKVLLFPFFFFCPILPQSSLLGLSLWCQETPRWSNPSEASGASSPLAHTDSSPLTGPWVGWTRLVYQKRGSPKFVQINFTVVR